MFILMEATEGQQIKADLVKIRNVYVSFEVAIGLQYYVAQGAKFQKSGNHPKEGKAGRGG